VTRFAVHDVFQKDVADKRNYFGVNARFIKDWHVASCCTKHASFLSRFKSHIFVEAAYCSWGKFQFWLGLNAPAKTTKQAKTTCYVTLGCSKNRKNQNSILKRICERSKRKIWVRKSSVFSIIA